MEITMRLTLGLTRVVNNGPLVETIVCSVL